MKTRLDKKKQSLTETDKEVRINLEPLDLQPKVVYLVSNEVRDGEGTITLRKSGEQPTNENGGLLWTMGIKNGRSIKIRKKRKRVEELSTDAGSDSRLGEVLHGNAEKSQQVGVGTSEADSRVASPPKCRQDTSTSQVDNGETDKSPRRGCDSVNGGAQSMKIKIQTKKSVKPVLPVTPAPSDDVTNDGERKNSDESSSHDESLSSNEIEVPIEVTTIISRPKIIQPELVFLTPPSTCNEAQVNIEIKRCSKTWKSHGHPLPSNAKLSTEMPSSSQPQPTATRETVRKSNQGPISGINTTATSTAGKATLLPRSYFSSIGETQRKLIPIPSSHDTALEMSKGRKNTFLGIESAGLSASEKENKRRGNISTSESDSEENKELLADSKRRRNRGRTLKDSKKPLHPPAFVPEKTIRRQRIRLTQDSGSNSIINIPNLSLNVVDPKIVPPPATLSNEIEIPPPSSSPQPVNNFILNENDDNVENPSEVFRVSDVSPKRSTRLKKLGETTISNSVSSDAGNLPPKTLSVVNLRRTVPKQPNRPTVQRVELSVHAKKNLPKTMPNRKSNQPESFPAVKIVDGKSKFMRGGKEVVVDAEPKLPRETPTYDISVPWLCCFCNKKPFAKILMPVVIDNFNCGMPYPMGDLFGPYYAKIPSVNEEPPTQREIWMHGDCALWTRELILVCDKIRDLEKHLANAEETVCPVCGKPGASIECSDRRCEQIVHFPCAKWRGWIFNDGGSYCRQHITHTD